MFFFGIYMYRFIFLVVYLFIYVFFIYIVYTYIYIWFIYIYGILPIICKLLYAYMKTHIYIYKCCSIMFFHDLPIIYFIIDIFWRGNLHEINRPGAWESERYTDLESSPQRLGGASIDGFPVGPGSGMSC